MIIVPFSMARAALQLLLDLWGKLYVFGAEVRPGELLLAGALDCSETVERIFKDGLGLMLPDGAHNQYLFCRTAGHEVKADEKKQPFDLVFLWDKDDIGGHIGHVAIVFGEMLPVGGALLIEARGKPWNHVMLTPLEAFEKQFGERVAGIYRLLEIEPLREP